MIKQPIIFEFELSSIIFYFSRSTLSYSRIPANPFFPESTLSCHSHLMLAQNSSFSRRSGRHLSCRLLECRQDYVFFIIPLSIRTEQISYLLINIFFCKEGGNTIRKFTHKKIRHKVLDSFDHNITIV